MSDNKGLVQWIKKIPASSRAQNLKRQDQQASKSAIWAPQTFLELIENNDML